MTDTQLVPAEGVVLPCPRESRRPHAEEPEDRTCLVAVDDTEASVAALVWALRHALDHCMRVEVLTVWPAYGATPIHDVPGHVGARWQAQEAQAAVVRRALGRVPGSAVSARRLENANAVTAIASASTRCELVVLGAGPARSAAPQHRDDPLPGRVIATAACPVVVVRGTAPPRSAGG